MPSRTPLKTRPASRVIPQQAHLQAAVQKRRRRSSRIRKELHFRNAPARIVSPIMYETTSARVKTAPVVRCAGTATCGFTILKSSGCTATRRTAPRLQTPRRRARSPYLCPKRQVRLPYNRAPRQGVRIISRIALDNLCPQISEAAAEGCRQAIQHTPTGKNPQERTDSPAMALL